jgi:adenosine deaminase
MRAAHGLSDETLARLAAMSVEASCAPDEVKRALLGEVADWLSAEPASATMTP